ncbi:hypothetical protein CY35_12G085200 [Sphagnum magellanicum]|nr:hypothetical protein CY35_12G085200 [Sphagnum magellanicum]
MDLQTIPACVHPTAKLSRLEWAFEFYMFMFIIDDLVEHKTHASSLEDLEEFFLELMVVIISSFPEDHILKENLTKYFNDEIDHKSTKDFAKKYLRELCNILKQVLMNARFLQFVPVFQTCGQEQRQRCLNIGTLDLHELYNNLCFRNFWKHEDFSYTYIHRFLLICHKGMKSDI